MYLNTTSVQNRKHKYTQEIIIKTGCWSFRSPPTFVVCGVITCCKISKNFIIFYLFGDSKKLTFFRALCQFH